MKCNGMLSYESRLQSNLDYGLFLAVGQGKVVGLCPGGTGKDLPSKSKFVTFLDFLTFGVGQSAAVLQQTII